MILKYTLLFSTKLHLIHTLDINDSVSLSRFTLPPGSLAGRFVVCMQLNGLGHRSQYVQTRKNGSKRLVESMPMLQATEAKSIPAA